MASAARCPDCAVGVSARSLVFTDDVLFHASAALAPFLVLALVASLADRLGRSRER